jgi:hypothetical protein
MAPLFTRAHGRQHLAGHQVEAPQVGRHCGIPVFDRQLFERLEQCDAGIVYQDIDRSQFLNQHRYGGLHVGFDSDIRRVNGDGDACLFETILESTKPRGSPGAGGDLVAGLPQAKANRATDSFSRTSD